MESKSKLLYYNEKHLDIEYEVAPLPDNKNSDSKQKGIIYLVSINALVCGLEMVASCMFTYIPPLLLKSGFSEFLMTTILGAAPFVDVITVPLLAEWSDKSTLKMGKRRPVIIGLSLLLLLSLVSILFSSRIASHNEVTGTLNMAFLALGVIFLDYSYQAMFNPCEALLSDLMATSDNRTQTLGFSIYSACMSLGCIIGYLMVCVKWTAVIPLNLHQEQMCFLISTIFIIPCIALTLSIKESPHNYSDSIEKKTYCFRNIFQMQLRLPREPSTSLTFIFIFFMKKIRQIFSSAAYILKRVFALPIGCYRRVQMAPTVIRRIFLVELFGWTTLHCHDKFFTDFVGQYVYKGHPSAKELTPEATLYDDGVLMGSWCLFLQSLSACLYAFFLQQHLVNWFGPRAVFIGSIFVLFVSMALTLALPNVTFLKFSTAMSGIGTAALTTTPNMLATLYFQNKHVYMSDLLEAEDYSSIEKRGLGAEVAVLDMAYFLSQIILSIFLAPLIEVFKSSLLYIAVSTVASGITFYCASRVVFSPEDFQLVRKGRF